MSAVPEHLPGHLRDREVVRGAVVKATAAAETPAVLKVAAHRLAHRLAHGWVRLRRARFRAFFQETGRRRESRDAGKNARRPLRPGVSRGIDGAALGFRAAGDEHTDSSQCGNRRVRRLRALRRAYLCGGAGRLEAAVCVAAAVTEARALRSRGGGRRVVSAREARARGPREPPRATAERENFGNPRPLTRRARRAVGRFAGRVPMLGGEASMLIVTHLQEVSAQLRARARGWGGGRRQHPPSPRLIARAKLATLFQPCCAARGVGRVGAPARPHARFDRSDPVLGCSARPSGRGSRRAPRITRARTRSVAAQSR